jgi:hypothetical protein
MATARSLMIASEVLAGLALIVQFLLPVNFDVGFRLSAGASMGIPVRWIVPLLLISGAGLIGTTALLKILWTVTHQS